MFTETFVAMAVGIHMLQCAVVCCVVLQRVAVCCSVLQCAAMCCSVLQSVAVSCSVLRRVAVCDSVLQSVAAGLGKGKHESACGEGAVMGWLRLVGSIKLPVSFAEYSLFCRSLLQKRPII